MIYSDKVMDHFSNPRNVGTLPDANGVGQVGNPVCGDMMTFYIKVQGDKLSDIKFQTFGCGAAIAVSSMVSEMALGKTLDEAMAITNEKVADELGGLQHVDEPHVMERVHDLVGGEVLGRHTNHGPGREVGTVHRIHDQEEFHASEEVQHAVSHGAAVHDPHIVGEDVVALKLGGDPVAHALVEHEYVADTEDEDARLDV